MKIQVTKIEAGQNIKVARARINRDLITKAIQGIKDGKDWYKEYLAEAEAELAKGIDGSLDTSGKHTLEFKVLEVKEYAGYDSYSLNGRTVGWNDTLLVTDKGTYLVPNRNKVTLVD